MDSIDVAAIGNGTNRDVSQNLKEKPRPVLKPVAKVKLEQSEQEKRQELKRLTDALDKYIKNTRYSYYVNEKIDQFVVRIIDKQTDNVIKEIPSQDIQRMHENIQEAVGILFDTQI